MREGSKKKFFVDVNIVLGTSKKRFKIYPYFFLRFECSLASRVNFVRQKVLLCTGIQRLKARYLHLFFWC